MNSAHILETPRQHGFAMIEVLVSILILSIGLLGLAAMQAFSLKNSQSAYYRSIASQLAYDMSDRMRGNMAGVRANHYNKSGIATDYAVGVAACITATGCSVSDLAKNDAFEWQALIGTLLPNGQGIICIDSTPDDSGVGPVPTAAAPRCDGVVPANASERPLHAIKIWWVDDRTESNAAGTPQMFVYSFRL